MRTLLIDTTSTGPDLLDGSDLLDGHDIVRCHHAEGPAFPCAGLTDEGCPIEHGPIDVAITVRPEGAAAPTAEEAGATCAARVGIPMVVLGGTEQPFAPWSVTAASVDDLPEAVDRAIAMIAKRRAEPIEAEVRRVLEVEGVDAGQVAVEVTREGDDAHILIRTEHEVSESLAGTLATRAHAVDQQGSWPTSKVAVAVGRLS
jgi:hypothetical protein